MAQMQFTDFALKDIREIVAYLLETRGFDKAIEGRQNIIDQARILAEMPRMGVPRPELIEGIYGFPRHPYLYLYWIQEGDGIEVARIIHMSRDIPAELRNSKGRL